MNDLFNRLTSELGIDLNQARRGAGLFFKTARDRLDAEDFDHVTEEVGRAEIQAVMDEAPELEKPKGLLGGLAKLSGNDDMKLVTQMIGAFGSLGMNQSTLKAFAKIMLAFIEEHGGDRVQEIRDKLGYGAG